MIGSTRPWPTAWGEVIGSVAELDLDDMTCFGAAERGWITVLIREELQGVLDNLEQQVANPGVDLMIRATAHYVDNDAFIELP
ncbi:hypothetical protein G7043_17445 [Lentzea sp. NEAU-D13]|uniref:DUF7716 domain-containing protein n=1 Tax=Lentzea alba TaxID=2714351 RepID=A0A7C9VY46_9PSEU|nr:hypothetical protein [Lentzea alba]NGY60717.1 hypothetical protein [Lentzea alba]